MSKFYRITVITFCCLMLAVLILGTSSAVFFLRQRECDTKDVEFESSTVVENGVATLRISLKGSPYCYSSYSCIYKEESDEKTYAYLYIYGTYKDKEIAVYDETGFFTLEIPLDKDIDRLILQGEDSKKTIWIRSDDD